MKRSRPHYAFNIHLLIDSRDLLRVAINLLLFFQLTPGLSLAMVGADRQPRLGEATGLWRRRRDLHVARK